MKGVQRGCIDLGRGGDTMRYQWGVGVNGGRSGEELRVFVYKDGKKYIPLAVCQMSNSCWTLGYCSRIIFCIDEERPVAITSTSRPKSRISVIPLVKPSGSMAPELVASVH